MPNKTTTDNNYRYNFQGQEKDPETGMEAFELRLWDGRLGRWLTVDPCGQYASPYLGMGNNPISRIDPDGGIDGGPEGFKGLINWTSQTSSYLKEGGTWTGNAFRSIKHYFVIPIYQELIHYTLEYSDTSGPHGGSGGSTSIFRLYGNFSSYTNSAPNGDGGFLGNMTEPNNSLFLYRRFTNSNLIFGLNYFKNKLKDVNGTGFQHPSSFHLTLGINNLNNFNIGATRFSTRLSIGFGPEVGIPRSNLSPAGDKKNQIIGYGGSLLYTLRAHIIKGVYLHTTATFHHMQTVDQPDTQYKGGSQGSIGISGGIGVGL